MCEAALDEAAVLSSIYCGAGEFQLLQQSGGWNTYKKFSVNATKDNDNDISYVISPL